LQGKEPVQTDEGNVHVNGHKAVELTNDSLGRLHGRLALQLHGARTLTSGSTTSKSPRN